VRPDVDDHEHDHRPVNRPDRLALVAAVCLAALAVIIGVRTSDTTEDVDETAFHQTLVEMRSGTGYYDALRDGLTAKEGRPPSQIRSYRLPTLYLGLALLPEGAWRWATILPVALLLISAWAIGRQLHEWGAMVAVVLVGCWAIAATPYLYLHPELWGAAALLAGLAFLQRERVAATAVCFAAAALLRELYLLAFLFGFFRHRKALSWWLAAVAVGTLAIVHIHLARQVLEPRGLEAPLRLATSDIPAALSPSGAALGIAVGVVGLVLGAAGLVHGVRAGDAAAQIAAAHSIVLVALTLRFGHTYWGLTFGPGVAAFAGGSLDSLTKIAGRRPVGA
jgi:hypothetical protein